MFVVAVATLGFAACGGSKSDSNDASTKDSQVVTEDSASASTSDLATFCKQALDNAGGADIADDDDPTKIAEKLSTNADTLADIASKAPDAVKADALAVAEGARKMADAITADPTLDKFNTLIAEFATSDANTASERVQTWVKDNCEAGQS